MQLTPPAVVSSTRRRVVKAGAAMPDRPHPPPITTCVNQPTYRVWCKTSILLSQQGGGQIFREADNSQSPSSERWRTQLVLSELSIRTGIGNVISTAVTSGAKDSQMMYYPTRAQDMRLGARPPGPWLPSGYSLPLFFFPGPAGLHLYGWVLFGDRSGSFNRYVQTLFSNSESRE